MGIGVLGPLTIDGSEATINRRDRAVLQALAASRGSVLSADRLADAVWGDQPPASWNKNVQQCVMRLRRVLGEHAITTHPQGYRLAMDRDDLDAGRFERLVDRAREVLTLGEVDRARYALDEALSLWRGAALPDLVDWDAGQIEAQRLTGLRLDAEELRLDCALRDGEHAETLTELVASVKEQPLRERRWALLALAQYRCGRQADALQTLRQVRGVLARELGLDPGPELVGLETAILRQDPGLLVEAKPREGSDTCPYKGLVSYDIEDSEAFFGRETDIATCLDRLAHSGAVVVVGPSGSGKSSVVRAGIAAALQREGRRVQVITPGAHPMTALAALGPSDVLVVDQCEEAVTLCTDPAERAAFFHALADQPGLVVALRADRIGTVAEYPRFARVVERAMHLLNPMTTTELQAAIASPADQAGLLLEPGLVDLLLRDVEGEPGALPLLSHALRETWMLREGRTLTVDGYRATGGIRGAVARTADEVWSALGPDQQRATRDLLLRLVTTGDEGEPVRRRVPLRLIATGRTDQQVVERLVAARLVTSDEGSLQVAHEALARAWPRLQDWLAEDTQGQHVRHHLSAAADAWDALGRPDTELYRGVRLAQAKDWRDRSHPNLTPVEATFLEVSEAQVDRELQAAQQQAERDAAARRRTRRLAAGLATFLALALIAAALATHYQRQAEDRADQATAATAVARDEATRADARRVGEEARATTQIDRALLLAVEGVRLDDSPETRANLLAVLGKYPGLIAPHRDELGVPVFGVSPDGSSALTSTEGRLVLRDFATNTTLAESSRVESVKAFTDVAFRPDGSQVAVLHNSLDPFAVGERRSFAPRPVVLYDAETLVPAPRQPGGLPARAAPRDVAFSGDGRWLAVSFARFHSADDADPFATPVLVWDLNAPTRPSLRIDAGSPSNRIELSRNGGRLYVARFPPGDLRVYEVATGRQLDVARGVGSRIAISADRSTVAVTGLLNGGRVNLLDATTLEVRTQLSGLSSLAEYAAPVFSPDGALVAAADFDANVVLIWDVATGALVHQLMGYTEQLTGTWFDPDGRKVHAGTESGTHLSWDLSNADRFVQRRPAPPGLDPADFVFPGPDGTIAYVNGAYATPAPGGAVQLRAPGADSVGAPRPLPHDGVSTLAWNADGSRFATTGNDGTVRLWDPRDLSTPVRERKLVDGLIEWITYLPDGRMAVIETNGETYAIEGDTLADAGPHIDAPHRLFFGHAAWDDLVFVVTQAFDDVLLVADLAAGKVVDRLNAGFPTYFGAASPDRSRIAITGVRGELRIYARDGGWLAPFQSAHTGAITWVSWAADGSLVTTGGADGTVALWDGRTGALLGAFTPGSVGIPVAPSFANGADQVSVAAADGPIYTFSTDVEDWIDFACDVAGRDLTPDEWRDSFDDRAYRRTCD